MYFLRQFENKSIRFLLPCHCCVHISVSARISIKTISQKFQGFWAKRFGDAAKDCWSHNDSINLIKNTGEGNWFSVILMMLSKHNDVAKTCSYGSKLSANIEIKYLVHFKVFFHILSTFRTGCLSNFKKPSRLLPHENQFT